MSEETTEYLENVEEVKAKVDQIADLIAASNHTTLFTGAGLSTSAGIPDFRGPQGVWTLKAQGKKPKRVDLSKAAPTVGHAICKTFLERQHVHHIVSQNVDGLHRKSGVPGDLLSELHGNTNLEYCERCGKEYFRDFRCRKAGISVHDHKTGRKCEARGCRGNLLDSIINFGENLPEKQWASAEKAFQQTNLCIVLGSSCRVTPAADLPQGVGKRGRGGGWPKLVIVNLQTTPLDGYAALKVHAKTDDFLSLLALRLGIQLPGTQSSPPPVAAAASPAVAGPISETAVAAAPEQAVCVVCCDRPANFLVVPCGHQCGCESCLAKVVTSKGGCPICRSPIESIQRVFRAGVDLDTPIPAGKTERTLSAAAAQKAAMERLSGSMRNLRVGASAGAARRRSSSNDAACS